ncbi:MAG: succinate-semialdehyde dehydrogenase / glutarate-semialdehyde dehydrogenase [Verrucomicrobia bacterium]|nr:MAG: succinate-semialdehyde dehydrogenase / glutarate-semialdehyde dehydrogenase [Verrucomicrobiota bacterium]
MSIASTNPATGELLKTFNTLSADEINEVAGLAAEAQKLWALQPIEARAEPMLRAARLLQTRAEEFARLMALEMGKPLREGVAEVLKCATACEFYAEHAARFLTPREEATDAARSYVRYDPLGVILAVMPWNFPFWQVFRFIAPQLMAGNGGLLKHASNVPQCALAIEALLREAGFPSHLFRTLLANSDQIPALIADARVAGVTLTGSESAGIAVATAAGHALKPVVLELGGSDPFIVLKDADLQKAAATGAASRTLNAGQSCIGAKRFIVAAEVHDRFLAALVLAMEKISAGDPSDPETGMGPLARLDLREEVHAQVATAIAHGGRLELGGTLPEGPGAFYPPSVLSKIGRDNPIYHEEVFGPVAMVFRAENEAQALEAANDSRFGLGASLWTTDRDAAQKWIPRLEAGAVFINGMVKSDPRLPFGGIKSSGIGRELGAEGIRAFMNVKTVWIG